MKKVLYLLLASFLVLAACGNKEESKSEDKKEDESKKSNDDKKEDSDKEDATNTDESQQANTEQQPQNVEQPQSKQEPVQSQEQQPVQQEPTDQEKMEANAKVAKEHGYTGIPNGDAGLLDSDAAYNEIKEQEAAEQAEQEAKEAKLQEEYFDLSDKMYGEKDYSDEEMEQMERRQNEILDEVEPIN